MVRDLEIKKLILHAKSMGFIVIIRNTSNDSADAEFDWESKRITIYKMENMSKTMVVLRLIHEIAHLIGYIKKNRKVNNTMLEAYDKFSSDINTKKTREYILKDEQRDLKHWDSIVAACDIKIPKWRIDMQKEVDICMYELYYLLGDDCNDETRDYFYKIIKKRYYANKRPNSN